MTRPVLALVAGSAAAALGAVILGEYELVGVVPLLAGPIFGVVVSEATATVARARLALLILAVGLLSAAGLVWAVWISTGHSFDQAAGTAWAGVVLGALAAALWFRSGGRRGERSQDRRTPAPGG